MNPVPAAGKIRMQHDHPIRPAFPETRSEGPMATAFAVSRSAPHSYTHSMPQHIGIVACSAEGAALCYRTVCIEGAPLLGPHDHPDVSMHTHSLGQYMKCIYRADWQGVGDLMLSSADKLARW